MSNVDNISGLDFAVVQEHGKFGHLAHQLMVIQQKSSHMAGHRGGGNRIEAKHVRSALPFLLAVPGNGRGIGKFFHSPVVFGPIALGAVVPVIMDVEIVDHVLEGAPPNRQGVFLDLVFGDGMSASLGELAHNEFGLARRAHEKPAPALQGQAHEQGFGLDRRRNQQGEGIAVGIEKRAGGRERCGIDIPGRRAQEFAPDMLEHVIAPLDQGAGRSRVRAGPVVLVSLDIGAHQLPHPHVGDRISGQGHGPGPGHGAVFGGRPEFGG